MKTVSTIQMELDAIQETLHLQEHGMMDYWVGQLGALLWVLGHKPCLFDCIRLADEMWFASRVLRRRLTNEPLLDLERERQIYRVLVQAGLSPDDEQRTAVTLSRLSRP